MIRAAMLTAALIPALLAPWQSPGAEGARQGPDEPAAEAAQDARAGGGSAYVNVRYVTTESLSRAAALVTRGEWGPAAAAYQAIVDGAGDQVVQISQGVYVGLRRHVAGLIARWPAEGLAAYRQQVEAKAAAELTRLEAEGAAEDLAQLAERFYATRAGATALDRAGELAIERGDLDAARQWYARLVNSHPDRAELLLTWRAKIALCDSWEADAGAIRDLLAACEAREGGPLVKWAGREERLSAFLRRHLIERGSASQEIDGTSESPGGAEPAAQAAVRHSRPAADGVPVERRPDSEAEEGPGARVWSVDNLGESPEVIIGGGFDSALARREAAAREYESGRWISRLPVAGEGWTFVHDGSRAWAVDPASPDAPVWEYTMAAPPSEPETTSLEEPPALNTSTYHDGRLFVPLCGKPGDDDSDAAAATTTLVCLDARSGREVWRNSLKQFGSRFERTRIDGSPVVSGNHAVTVVRRCKGFGFEAAFLAAFDIRNGALAWTTHLGEAPTGTYGYRRATLCLATRHGDSVFVSTNLGTIAAVSASTGQVIWLRTYPCAGGEGQDGFWPSRLGMPVRSWHYQAPLVWRDRVLFMPLDAENLLVCRQSDGEMVARPALEGLGMAATLLGVRGDQLFLAGSQVTCYDLNAGRIDWQRPIPQGRLFGRGAVGDRGVFVPTDRGLATFPIDGGPAQLFTWPIEDAGNVLALAGEWIVAGPNRLISLAGVDRARDRLMNAMDAAPREPRAALRLADLEFSRGEYERGMSAVEEALRRAGGVSAAMEPALRERLYGDLWRFASLLVEAGRGGSIRAPLEYAVRLYEVGGRLASHPTQRVGQWHALARTHLLRGDASAAIEMVQRVLQDRALRAAVVEAPPRIDADPDGGPDGQPARRAPTGAGGAREVAGLLAEQWIEQIIGENGRAAYAPVELRAGEAVRRALATDDDRALLEVVDAFPNSLACGDALLTHARRRRAARDWSGAARSLRRAYALGDRVDRRLILRELPLCLRAAGHDDLCAQWLDRAVREYPSERFLHEGRQIGFEAYRKLLLGERADMVAAGPRVDRPLTHGYSSLHGDRIAVLDPAYPRRADPWWDMLLTWSGEQITCHEPASDRSIWPRPVSCAQQPVLLGMTGRGLVMATSSRLFSISRDRGEALWSIGQDPDPDPKVDPESAPTWVETILTNQCLVAANARGELICVDPGSGAIRWRRADGPRTASGMAADGSRAAIVSTQGPRSQVRILNIEDGSDQAQVDIQDDRPIQSLVLPEGGPLLVFQSRRILAFDPRTGQDAWQIETPDGLVLATLQIAEEGLFISPDGARVAKYDLVTGRRLWMTPPIGSDRREGLWTTLVAGRLLCASANALMTFDDADGRPLWKADDFPGMRSQAPHVVCDGLVLVHAQEHRGRRGRTRGGDSSEGRAFRICRVRLSDGQIESLGADGELVTERIESFGGAFVRDGAVIVVDGQRLIGFVSKER